MTKFKVGEAALLVGKSAPTLGRAVKSGKISVTKDDNGTRLFDGAELERVYGTLNFDALEQNEIEQGVSQTNMKEQSPVVQEDDPAVQNLLLKQEVKLLKIRLDEKEKAHEEYRNMTEKSLQALLTYQPEPIGQGGDVSTPKSSFSRFLLMSVAGAVLVAGFYLFREQVGAVWQGAFKATPEQETDFTYEDSILSDDPLGNLEQ